MSEESPNERKFAVTVLYRKYTEFHANVKVNLNVILQRILSDGDFQVKNN